MCRILPSRYVFILLAGLALPIAACQRAQEAPAPAPAAAAQPEFVPAATIKDLMLGVIDGAADDVWLSVSTTVSEKGMIDTRPQNDEEWEKVRYGALTLIEASNLLTIPRRVARPGEKSVTPGVELEPEEMDKLINDDRAGWVTRAKALHDAALEALRAAEAKDADKVFEVGETIQNACEGCHQQYWYPNEKIPELPVGPEPTTP